MALSSDHVKPLLDRISDHLEECRAAAATAEDGDPEALGALGSEVDAIAQAVAELKAAVSSPLLGER